MPRPYSLPTKCCIWRGQVKKLGAVALAATLFTAACSSHGGGGSPVIPQGATSPKTGKSVAATAPAGWATTNTQALNLANATDLGALDASKVLTVRVGLQLRNAQQLQQTIAQNQIVSSVQFASQYAPTQDQVSSVVSYLTSKGLTNISVEPNNLLIGAEGTVAQIQSAFNTTIESYSVGGANVFANTSAALVPSSLNGIVVAVLGLNNLKLASKPLVGTNCGTSVAPTCLSGFTPRGFWHAYDAADTPTATNTTMAVMAEGNVSQVISDLRSFEATNGLPQVPVSVVHVGLQSPDTSGVLEWDLDTQSSTGIAGNVKQLYIYDTTSLTDSDITLEYNRWATQNVAQLGNSSFGECEVTPYLDGAMLVNDEVFAQAASQGQTMFASSGDTGSACAVVPTNGAPGSGPPLVEWPAASSYVVAVGGTTLTVNADETYKGELAWNAGGGGLSQFEYSPSWQNGIQPASSTPIGFTFRGVPDIAMDADELTGAQIINGGAATSVGGTSLASPLAMGVYSRLQSAHANALGYAPPRFYAVYAQNPTAGPIQTGPPPTEMIGGFHDILTGVNGTYSALPKYDYTTGLGSIDIAVMNGAIGH